MSFLISNIIVLSKYRKLLGGNYKSIINYYYSYTHLAYRLVIV